MRLPDWLHWTAPLFALLAAAGVLSAALIIFGLAERETWRIEKPTDIDAIRREGL